MTTISPAETERHIKALELHKDREGVNAPELAIDYLRALQEELKRLHPRNK